MEKKVSDLSVDEFKEISLGLKKNVLDGWFSDVTEKVSRDLSNKLDEKIDIKIDAKLLSVGINTQKPDQEQEKQAFIRNLMKDSSIFRRGVISKVASYVTGGALVGITFWLSNL